MNKATCLRELAAIYKNAGYKSGNLKITRRLRWKLDVAFNGDDEQVSFCRRRMEWTLNRMVKAERTAFSIYWKKDA